MFNKFQLDTKAVTILSKAKLNGAASSVLLKFMFHINRSNMVVGAPADIAKLTRTSLREFNLGIRALKKYNFVRKYTKKEYMLNPDIMFNGDDKRYYVIKHMWDTQTTEGLRDNAGR
jgi:hypothetical protein